MGISYVVRNSPSVPQRLTSGDDPVAIRMYARSVEAALDVATLEAHGIAAQIMGDNVGDTLNWYGLAVQKVELVVPRRKAAEAQKILFDQAAQHSQNQRTDWVCRAAVKSTAANSIPVGRVGKHGPWRWTRNTSPRTLLQPLPTADDPIYVLPDQDENPYAGRLQGPWLSRHRVMK